MVSALSAALGAALLVVTAGALACALGVRDRAGFPAALLVLAAGTVVLQTIALSIVGAFTPAGLLVAGALAAAAAVAAWARAGRPSPPVYKARRGSATVAVRRHPEVVLLATVATAALLFQGFIAIRVAPSNWDSMTYHLSRGAYWLQYHSATPFPGAGLRQRTSPPDGEMLQAWTMAVAGSDRFAAFVQWAALAGIAACVYLGARLLGFARAHAVFAAALFAVLPQPILQATSTQNDLIAAFFVLASAVFGVRGLRSRRAGDLAVAAVAAGLAVGTKGTALALAPAVLVLLGAEAWRSRVSRRLVAGAIGGAVVAVIALGAWGYAQNLAHDGSLFGGLSGATSRHTPVATNTVRSLWTLVDSPGVHVPVLQTAFPRLAHELGQRFETETYRYAVDIAISEDTSAYGLVGWLLLGPVLLFYALRPRAGLRRAWAIAVLLGLLGFAVAFEFNEWVGRLLLPTVALAAPLLAGLAARRVLAILAIAAALVTLPGCLRSNPNKPLGGGPAGALRRDRIGQMTYIRPEVELVLRHPAYKALGARTPLAFVGTEDSWDYPFFGAHRERRVIRFARRPDPAAVRASGAKAVIFANVSPPRAFHAVRLFNDYWLARVS